MLYPIYRCGYALAKNLPLRVSYRIAEIVALVYFHFSRKDRKILSDNLKGILGVNAGKKEIDAHTLGILKNFAKYLVDFFRSAGLSKEDILKPVTVKNRQYLDEALSLGKGVIVLTAHLGNWELGAAAVAAMGYPISAIVLNHSDQRINTLFSGNRAINDVKNIPIGVAVRGCYRVLRQNEVLAIAGDRDYTGGGMEIEFFGKKTLMPKGAAQLALRTGASIVGGFLIRQPGDTFVLEFLEPISFEGTDDMDKDLDDLMKKCVSVLEDYVKKYVDQWYVFDRIWAE
ncbi:MAG: lysophospholipid acyltransferase family protein [Candidatus Omnitrophica bacterium]|nr:lysophospholipid acyltransferase family protein [Candidatus Omnitrophota bacterium]